MMKVTNEKLKRFNACEDGREWFEVNFGKSVEENKLITTLAGVGKYDWAWWYLRKVLTKEQSVKIAIYAAEQVIKTFEKEYPEDDRPRKAIEAAKAYLKNPCDKTAADAYAAHDAAYAAAYAANAAADAANAAANAAYAAAYAAAENKELRKKILIYALKIRGEK
jgi:hypothetical protein